MTAVESGWFVDESFWEAICPMMVSAEARAAGVSDVDAIGSLAAMRAGRVLDLCCGPGRHTVPLARRGFTVTAVDRSPYLLERAREYAASDATSVRWIESDMREFVEPASFDLAVCLFTSFGYFDDPADNVRVLQNVHASLARGGVFILDMVGKEIVARVFQPCGVQDLSDGSELVQRRRVVDDWSRVENEWSVLRGGTVRTFRFRHWIYSAAELRELLAGAGFSRVEIFGGLDASIYGPAANRLVARAEK